MASRICLGDLPTHLPQVDQRLGRATFLRPPIAGLVPSWSVAPEGVPLVPRIRPRRNGGGTGISTCRPSPTPRALGLGPNYPWPDEPPPEPLGHPADGPLPRLSLLRPAFPLPTHPRRGSPAASPAWERSP